MSQTIQHFEIAPRPPASQRAIAAWLFTLAAMILVMVSIGGITRLTGSGLSIVEWRPLMGSLPPLSEGEWARIFALYQTSPQYLAVNTGISLAEFEAIFWWEWGHRFWGRLIGVVFFLPFLWFLVRRQIGLSLAPRLAFLFILGGAQGVLGWYMVQSGLVDIPEVSQYRLAAHLALALALYVALFWTGLQLRHPEPETAPDRRLAGLRTLAMSTLGLVTITIGAFVAGTDAGFAYNTFPLMDGALVPAGYLPQPWYASPFEDIATIQFHHRVLAIVSLIVAIATWWRSRWIVLVQRARRVANGLLIMVCLQVALGISTLVLVVPTPLAAAHQTGAVLLLTVTLWLLFELRAPHRSIAKA
ncbi:MAG: COX15/CtaA family protein [Proteobacteria bacterium]|nr:COX15/CtaA family protein [Pseudomonadota bacterium]